MGELDTQTERRRAGSGRRTLTTLGATGLVFATAACGSGSGKTSPDKAGAYKLDCDKGSISKTVDLITEGQVVFDYPLPNGSTYELTLKRTVLESKPNLGLHESTFGAKPTVAPLGADSFKFVQIVDGPEFTVRPPIAPAPPTTTASPSPSTVPSPAELPLWHINASPVSDTGTGGQEVTIAGNC